MIKLISRGGWGARKANAKKLEPFKGPVDFMVVTQTAIDGECMNPDACCRDVRAAQDMDIADGKSLCYQLYSLTMRYFRGIAYFGFTHLSSYFPCNEQVQENHILCTCKGWRFPATGHLQKPKMLPRHAALCNDLVWV